MGEIIGSSLFKLIRYWNPIVENYVLVDSTRVTLQDRTVYIMLKC